MEGFFFESFFEYNKVLFTYYGIIKRYGFKWSLIEYFYLKIDIKRGITVRKMLFILIAIPFLLLGCSNLSKNSQLSEFDNSDLKTKLEDQAFQPKLPSKLPFEVEQAEFTPPPKDYMPVTIHFLSSRNGNGDHLELLIFNHKDGGNVQHSGVKFEDVKIGDIKAKYAVNDSEAMMLNWTEDDIFYGLTYYGKQSDTEITKEDLIETAKSFE